MTTTPCSRTALPRRRGTPPEDLAMRRMLDFDTGVECDVCHQSVHALKLMQHPSGPQGVIKVCDTCYPGDNK